MTEGTIEFTHHGGQTDPGRDSERGDRRQRISRAPSTPPPPAPGTKAALVPHNPARCPAEPTILPRAPGKFWVIPPEIPAPQTPSAIPPTPLAHLGTFV